MPHLSALSLALNRPGAVSLEQVVASLFASGEQGAWYDPSAANVTWRRNLLTRTEEFDNAAWITPVLATVASAPDPNAVGAMWAVNSTNDSLNSSGRYIGQSQTIVPSSQYTFSFYAKAGSISSVRFLSRNDDATRDAYFSLTGSGSVTASTNTTPTIESIGNGIYRCIVSWVSGADTSILCSINSGVSVFGDGSTMFYVSGPQFERSLLPTAYQRIVTPELTYLADVQAQPLLFQDSTGATPVTAVEQPVGLILDRRKGLVLGSELVTNGTFDTASDWTLGSGWSITGGKLVATSVAFGVEAKQAIAALVTGSRYVVTFDAVVTSGAFKVNLGGLGVSASEIAVSATGSYRYVPPRDGTAQITFWASSTFTGTIDNISVKLLDGNHAYQTGSTARPVLRARYNLLTYSEQFDQTAWSKFGSVGITANAAVAPDGTTTADKLIPPASSGTPYIRQESVPNTKIVARSCYAKSAGYNYLILQNDNNGAFALFDLSGSGTVVAASVGITATMQNVGNGWHRCMAVYSASSSGGGERMAIGTSPDGIVSSVFTAYTGDGTSGIYLWGADLRVGTSAGDYQRIAASTDYATVSTITGQAFRPYLEFPSVGNDDFLQTASIDFTGTDEMTVAVGLNKTSDASEGIVSELSASIDSNNGSWAMFAPGGLLAARDSAYVWATKGTTKVAIGTAAANYPAPVLRVVTATSDISADSAALRVNGTQVATSASDQGTGNYGNFALYIGRRAGVSTHLFGNIYGLIIRGKTCSAGEIASLETYLAGKAGLTL